MKKQYSPAEIFITSMPLDAILYSGASFYTQDDILDNVADDIFEGWWL